MNEGPWERGYRINIRYRDYRRSGALVKERRERGEPGPRGAKRQGGASDRESPHEADSSE